MKKLILCLASCLFLSSCSTIRTIDADAIFNSEIRVEIKGAVKNPGIYSLETGSTIRELFEMAVLLEDADTSAINEMIVLKNNDLLIVPFSDESKIKVSINTASVADLCLLPGIGGKTAERIVEYRSSHGLFQRIDELKNVSGIGDKKFDKLKDYIKL